MRRLTGAITAGLVIAGVSCGETEAKPVTNLTIEQRFSGGNLSDEMVAGLGLGVGEFCANSGLEIELSDVPEELLGEEFDRGINMARHNLSPGSMILACEAVLSEN